MTQTTVLLYNFTETEVKSWRLLMREMPMVKLMAVPKKLFGMIISDVLEEKETPVFNFGSDFSQRMLLIANAGDQMIHLLLSVCKRVTKEQVLRAVLTETNAAWSGLELYRNLREEEDEIHRMQTRKL